MVVRCYASVTLGPVLAVFGGLRKNQTAARKRGAHTAPRLRPPRKNTAAGNLPKTPDSLKANGAKRPLERRAFLKGQRLLPPPCTDQARKGSTRFVRPLSRCSASRRRKLPRLHARANS